MTSLAARHIRDILSASIQHSDDHSAVVVYDGLSELAVKLTQAYRECLPNARFIDFGHTSPDEIIKTLFALQPRDLVILIQSDSFRLGAFRIRVDLFARGIKVIEHPHLGAMQRPDEVKTYIDALAYDADSIRGTGYALKERLDKARQAVIKSADEQLVFTSGFEDAKLNVGDYSKTKNVGGQFPIGEVFTEAKDLEAVNGRIRIFAFGDTAFRVNKPDKPITLIIQKGKVIQALDTTAEFEAVLANIRADEDDIWVRELGFGLNRAFTQERLVSDIGTYERMCGVHLSLGAKHTIYKKPAFSRKAARHHVDVFVETTAVYLNDRVVYQDGAWQV